MDESSSNILKYPSMGQETKKYIKVPQIEEQVQVKHVWLKFAVKRDPQSCIMLTQLHGRNIEG